MKNLITYILAFTLLLPLTQLQAGGWPQPKGNGYFKLSEWWLVADQHYTDVGLIDPNQTTGLFNTTLYAEYGLTDRLTVVFNMPLFSRSYFNNQVSFTTGEVLIPGEAINSVGDADLGFRYGFFNKGGWAASASVILGIPLGEDSGGPSGILQTGDGEFNQMVRLDLGRGFRIGSVEAFANIYGAFNNRTNEFSDEYRFGLEGGATFLNKKITAVARLYGIRSLKNGTLPSEGITGTSIFANNSEFLAFSPEVAYNINEKWGVSAGFGQALSGKIIFANTSYTVGVFMKLQ
jgi:hypothetical protein